MCLGFPGAQMVNNLPAMQETQLRSLGWKDPLEKGMATHSSILAWRIPWTEEPGNYSPWAHKEMDTTERLSLSLDSERGLGEWNQIARTTRSFNCISQPCSSFCLLCCWSLPPPPSTHDPGDDLYFLVHWGVSSPPLACPSGKSITSDRLVWNCRFLFKEDKHWGVIYASELRLNLGLHSCLAPSHLWAFLVAQIVKNLPAMQEIQVRSLDWDNPLEKGMATHSSILAWRIPWTEEPGW